MVSKFVPEINKEYLIEKHTMFHILDGKGDIEVNFKHYFDWKDKVIFLEQGHYIKFSSDDFVVRRIEFEREEVFKHKDARVLFKHLVSLGYINFDECNDCQKYLNNTVLSSTTGAIIDVSSKQWYWQNPFHANKEEYHIIFDVKDLIDEVYSNHLNNRELSRLIKLRGYDAQALFKSKIGFSIKAMLGQKRLIESQKNLAFTDKSVKEIAYELGFKDPAYFNRIFRKKTGKSPNQFREAFDFERTDVFLQELYQLLKEHHQEERSVGFYAEQMHLPVKTLSRKVKDKLQVSIGQLIRHELVNTAKTLLTLDLKVNEIAYQLGFEEANHFTAFFKHYTGITPSNYKIKKYKR